MDAQRRCLLRVAASAAAALLFGKASGFAAQGAPRPPFPRQSQEEPPSPKPDTRPLLKLSAKEIKKDVERLLQLAEELKKEVDKTDSAEVLSVSLMRKAEEIEKLAKHIKGLARG